MRFTANDFPAMRLELAAAFASLSSPKQPTAVFACTTANRPPAADFPNCVLFDTTLNALKTSNGTAWV